MPISPLLILLLVLAGLSARSRIGGIYLMRLI
jgi:hypothetical protein